MESAEEGSKALWAEDWKSVKHSSNLIAYQRKWQKYVSHYGCDKYHVRDPVKRQSSVCAPSPGSTPFPSPSSSLSGMHLLNAKGPDEKGYQGRNGQVAAGPRLTP